MSTGSALAAVLHCCQSSRLVWDDEKIKRLFFVFRFGGMQAG